MTPLITRGQWLLRLIRSRGDLQNTSFWRPAIYFPAREDRKPQLSHFIDQLYPWRNSRVIKNRCALSVGAKDKQLASLHSLSQGARWWLIQSFRTSLYPSQRLKIIKNRRKCPQKCASRYHSSAHLAPFEMVSYQLIWFTTSDNDNGGWQGDNGCDQ